MQHGSVEPLIADQQIRPTGDEQQRLAACIGAADDLDDLLDRLQP